MLENLSNVTRDNLTNLEDFVKILVRESVRKNPDLIKEFQNIDNDEIVCHDLYLTALRQDGCLIKYIKHPTSEMKEIAVKENGLAIQFIEKPTKDMKFTAVTQNPRAIAYIDCDDEDYIDLCHNALCDDVETLSIIANKGPITSDVIVRVMLTSPLCTSYYIMNHGVNIKNEFESHYHENHKETCNVYLTHETIRERGCRVTTTLFEIMCQCLIEDPSCLFSFGILIKHMPVSETWSLCHIALTHEKIDKPWDECIINKYDLVDCIHEIFTSKEIPEGMFIDLIKSVLKTVEDNMIPWILGSELFDKHREYITEICCDLLQHNIETIRYIPERHQTIDVCRHFIVSCPDKDWTYLKTLIKNKSIRVKLYVMKRDRMLLSNKK